MPEDLLRRVHKEDKGEVKAAMMGTSETATVVAEVYHSGHRHMSIIYPSLHSNIHNAQSRVECLPM